MTSTVTRTSNAVAEWSKVFPRQAVETYTSSVTFMKQLTVVAVSTITYLKNAFPEDNYTIDQFGGLKLRILKSKCDDELAQFLISSLTQAFEAFDKKYLHQIALCFYEERCCPENLVEYHLFEYGYGGAGATVNVRSGGRGAAETVVTLDALRDRTVKLLRACMAMLSDTTLPESYDVSLRLYYNDDAPEGYQAPGFSAAADSWADEVIATSGAARLKLGSVATPFHRLQLHTYHRDMQPTSEDASVLSQEQNELRSSGQGAVDGTPVPTLAGAQARGAQGAGGLRDDVCCECGRDDRDIDMLQCRLCGSYQHSVCYGVLGGAGAGAGAGHVCVGCGERAGSTAGVDPGLLRASNKTCYAIFRRALWWLHSLVLAGGGSGAEGEVAPRVSVQCLGDALCLAASSTRKLMRVLKEYRVLNTEPPADTDVGVEVVPSELEAALTKYFRLPPSPSPPAEDDLASRLLEQSQQSQRSQSDPLEEVLSPLERVSLQATANTGVMMEPVAELDKQDSTLEQYRAALAPLDVNANKSPAAILTPSKRRGNKRKQDAHAHARQPGVKTKRIKKQNKGE